MQGVEKDVTVLYGKPVAENIYKNLEKRIQRLKTQSIVPCLRVILVGDDPASRTYVTMKAKKCRELGIDGALIELPADTSTEKLLHTVQALNDDTTVHGILVQLPLPEHIDTELILSAINPQKDVDGFHEINAGKLQRNHTEIPLPCTADAVIEFFRYYAISTESKHIVIIGRSSIVGRPLLQLLTLKREFGNATVTLCHSKTIHIEQYSSIADIVIVAIGIPQFLQASMVRDNSVVIDVGINRIALSEKEKAERNTDKNYALVGDANFTDLSKKCSAITPVPGGVGVVTIAALMRNTVQLAETLLK